MVLGKALLTVTLFLAVMCIVTYMGLFHTAKVELGIKHYAERLARSKFLPRWLKMPFNTFVNIGYVIVGAAWCAKTTLGMESNIMSEVDGYLFYTFNTMSAVYGGIQAVRILTQIHNFGVLDQWATLPFFALVLVWAVYLRRGWSSVRAMLVIVLSLASYGLTLLSPYGFELCLAVHISLATMSAILAFNAHPGNFALGYFIKAVLSCAGFVGFKLLDFQLAEYHRVFQVLSGHFISKVCDILQIHFVNCFFFSLTQHKLMTVSVKEKAE